MSECEIVYLEATCEVVEKTWGSDYICMDEVHNYFRFNNRKQTLFDSGQELAESVTEGGEIILPF
jgi:hypothetical protein